MRKRKVLAKALGVERAVVVGFDERDGRLVLRVRVRRGDEWRCPVCQRKCGRYDRPEHLRRWRAPDFGVMRVEVEASTPRVRCTEHGVHTAHHRAAGVCICACNTPQKAMAHRPTD